MTLVEPTEDTTGLPPSTEGADTPKIQILLVNSSSNSSSGSEDHALTDHNNATFVIRDEDHTLGNSLRYLLMKKYT